MIHILYRGDYHIRKFMVYIKWIYLHIYFYIGFINYFKINIKIIWFEWRYYLYWYFLDKNNND